MCRWMWLSSIRKRRIDEKWYLPTKCHPILNQWLLYLPKFPQQGFASRRSHNFPKQCHLLEKCLSWCLYTGRSDQHRQWARTESRKEVQLVRLSVDPHAHACLPSKTMSTAEKHISRSSKWLHLSPGKWAPWLLRKHPRFVMLFIYVGSK